MISIVPGVHEIALRDRSVSAGMRPARVIRFLTPFSFHFTSDHSHESQEATNTA
jgi:hypothetical protein